MKANSLRPALFSAMLAISACAVASAPAGPPPQLSMTRPMMVFAKLEQDLAGAVSSQDQATTDRLLSEDFEYRPSAHPGEPSTRADWLADASARGKGTDQLSVRDLGDVAVASFVMTRDDDSSSYVIDVWKKQGNEWQLITRFQSELPAAESSTGDIAPTGKG